MSQDATPPPSEKNTMFLTKAPCSYDTAPPLLPHLPHPYSFLSNNNICSSASKSSRVLRYRTVQPLSQADRDMLQGDTETPASKCIHKNGEDLLESLTCWHRHTNKSMNATQGFFSSKHFWVIVSFFFFLHTTPFASAFQPPYVLLHCCLSGFYYLSHL